MLLSSTLCQRSWLSPLTSYFFSLIQLPVCQATSLPSPSLDIDLDVTIGEPSIIRQS